MAVPELTRAEWSWVAIALRDAASYRRGETFVQNPRPGDPLAAYAPSEDEIAELFTALAAKVEDATLPPQSGPD